MSVRALVRETWGLYRRTFWRVLAIAAPVFVALNLLYGLISSVFLSLLFGIIVVSAAYGLVESVVVAAAGDERREGSRATPLALLRLLRPLLGAIALASVLATLGVMAGMVLLIVPGLILFARWGVLIPVLVLERATWRDAFGRSRQLVRGYAWPVFLVLAAILVLGFGLFVIPPRWLSDDFSLWALAVLADSLIVPFYGAATAALYYMLGDLHEGVEPRVNEGDETGSS